MGHRQKILALVPCIAFLEKCKIITQKEKLYLLQMLEEGNFEEIRKTVVIKRHLNPVASKTIDEIITICEGGQEND